MAMQYEIPVKRRAPAAVRYGPFIFAGVMVLLAAISSWTGLGKVSVEPEAAIETMSIRFADEADGGIGVYDPDTNALLHVYPPETGGFVRTALRALALDRRRRGIGPQPAFELRRAENGSLTLLDPSTDKFVTLGAFGKDNAETFGQLFAEKSGGIS
ncbi:MAG: photosynthetic complex assembly protein PuhC [Pseudomonadota bacterium]